LFFSRISHAAPAITASSTLRQIDPPVPNVKVSLSHNWTAYAGAGIGSTKRLSFFIESLLTDSSTAMISAIQEIAYCTLVLVLGIGAHPSGCR
jgi:hypothetical protein